MFGRAVGVAESYEAVVSGEVAPDPREIAWHGWLTDARLRDAVGRWRFVPDGQEAFRHYLSAIT